MQVTQRSVPEKGAPRRKSNPHGEATFSLAGYRATSRRMTPGMLRLHVLGNPIRDIRTALNYFLCWNGRGVRRYTADRGRQCIRCSQPRRRMSNWHLQGSKPRACAEGSGGGSNNIISSRSVAGNGRRTKTRRSPSSFLSSTLFSVLTSLFPECATPFNSSLTQYKGSMPLPSRELRPSPLIASYNTAIAASSAPPIPSNT